VKNKIAVRVDRFVEKVLSDIDREQKFPRKKLLPEVQIEPLAEEKKAS
jgi:hypothetical protein